MNPVEFVRREHAALTALRRDLHAHPELGFEEHRTAEVVARELDPLPVIEEHGWPPLVRGVGMQGTHVEPDLPGMTQVAPAALPMRFAKAAGRPSVSRWRASDVEGM